MDKNKVTRFHLLDFRWLLLVNTIIVCGAVMSFGLIATQFLDLGSGNAITMLYMIPPMVIAVALSSAIILHSVRKRMNTLLDGIQSVAGGNMDVVLDAKGAEEYTLIYDSFNRMVQELKGTKEEMQGFVNEFSHEFKTPITSISGFSQYLINTGEGIESPERMKYLQVIYDESLRLSELSQNTLLLSKMEACQIITEKQSFDLSEQIKHCVIILLSQIERKKVVLDVDIPDISYYGNPEMIEQVWLNLISNAIKFTPENGEISIRGAQTEQEVCIHISDTGVGMDAETIDYIFDKYYQNDTVNSVRGSGIGLSIVARIVALCGGRVDVSSSLGEGSTFAVYLPR